LDEFKLRKKLVTRKTDRTINRINLTALASSVLTIKLHRILNVTFRVGFWSLFAPYRKI